MNRGPVVSAVRVCPVKMKGQLQARIWPCLGPVCRRIRTSQPLRGACFKECTNTFVCMIIGLHSDDAGRWNRYPWTCIFYIITRLLISWWHNQTSGVLVTKGTRTSAAIKYWRSSPEIFQLHNRRIINQISPQILYINDYSPTTALHLDCH